VDKKQRYLRTVYGVFLIFVGAAILTLTVGPEEAPSNVVNSLARNLGSDLLSLAIVIAAIDPTIALIEKVTGRGNEVKRRKAELISQLGSRVNTVAVRAAELLAQERWLTDGTLRGVFLRNANLEGAALLNADLQEAHLELANVQRADLRDAKLAKANLEEASLKGSDLTGTDLQGANLEDANLEDAFLDGVGGLQGRESRRRKSEGREAVRRKVVLG
jgi:uncharacterized protein YjbI with pentapeptide repeats